MIENLQLSYWKRHRELSVDFQPGLNFVLGANGSGKSSVLQAACFALTGVAPHGCTLQDAIHVGWVRGAVVSTRLRTLAGEATVTRTLDAHGGQSERIEPTSTEAAGLGLAELLGVDGSEAARLLFVGEGDVYSPAAAALGLDAHLERLLGTQQVQQYASAIVTTRRALARDLKSQRDTLRVSTGEVAAMALRREELEVELESLEAAEVGLVAGATELAEQRARVGSQADARTLWVEWVETVRALRGADMDPEHLDAAMELAAVEASRARADVSQFSAAVGRLQGEIAATAYLLQLLEGGNDRAPCPLCDQALDAEHRAAVEGRLASRVAELEGELASVSADARSKEAEADVLAANAMALRDLHARRPTNPGPVVEQLPVSDDGVLGQLAELRESRRRAFDEVAVIRERLASIEADRRVREEVVRAFRHDALLQIAEGAIGSFLSDLRQGVVAPLGAALTTQWKLFRPQAPWTIVVDEGGRLVLEMDGERRPFANLSAGEKTVALILLRLALCVALTSARFIVLDEPLEHLDPRSRRMLVSSLQHAVADGSLDQIIVSTYEEPLARRLQAEGLATAVYVDR